MIIGFGKRQLEYRDELINSGEFKFLPTVGIQNVHLSPKDDPLLVIPCTFASKLTEPVPYRLNVYSSETINVSEIVKTWDNISTCKQVWEVAKGTAGGSPNNENFLSNPQFVVIPPKDQECELVVDLTVPDASHAIGFLVIRRDREEDDSEEGLKKYSPISPDDDEWKQNIFIQPNGWEKRVSRKKLYFFSYASLVSAHGVGTKENNAKSVYYIIPSTFEPNIGKPFSLTVYSDQPVRFYHFTEGKLVAADPEDQSNLANLTPTPKPNKLKKGITQLELERDMTITGMDFFLEI